MAAGSMSLLNACRQPVEKIIPYLIQPEELSPGESLYYASHYYDGVDFGNLLVKTREGRPIKIEGNPHCPFAKGGTTARLQALLPGLYNPDRIKTPTINKQDTPFKDLDNFVSRELQKLNTSNKPVALVTPTIISRTAKLVINSFVKKFPNTEHIEYDIFSYNAIRNAYETLYGHPIIPDYQINKSELIISLGADFLGTWLHPLKFNEQYSRARDNGTIHYQFEHIFSFTGSNAHKRWHKTPSEQSAFLVNLYNYIAKKTGKSLIKGTDKRVKKEDEKLIELIYAKQNKALVLCGSENYQEQLITAQINFMLGNWEKTIIPNDFRLFKGSETGKRSFVDQVKAGYYGGIISYCSDFIYDNCYDKDLKEAFATIEFTVDLSSQPNETNSIARISCPDHHYFESWKDAECYSNTVSFGQPLIKPLFNTRQFEDSLLKWSNQTKSYKEFIEEYWREMLGIAPTDLNGWSKILQKGVIKLLHSMEPIALPRLPENFSIENKTADRRIGETLYIIPSMQILLPEHANNPWLQELPDPLTKTCWENYALVSELFANKHRLEHGDIVLINNSLEIPVFILPGQPDFAVSIYYGYGQNHAGKIAKGSGTNPLILASPQATNRLEIKIESLSQTGKKVNIATTQQYHHMNGEYIKRVLPHEIAETSHSQSFYPDYEYKTHKWGMVIDLDKCTGCNTCITACQSENNIPVVGKQEVTRGRNMHWIRIDRYFEGSGEKTEVLRQPVMCQHCNNAPCENVCPVSATTHSSEGVNQMIYNRCIGTRYCSNNCPYKVRAFNWFDYNGADSIRGNTHDNAQQTHELYRLLLNPDVVVRTKGVIEKCSFCYQRIAEEKIKSKMKGEHISDGKVKTACGRACPSKAITFGDLNDPASAISQSINDTRQYSLLGELNTKPSVRYLAKKKRTDLI